MSNITLLDLIALQQDDRISGLIEDFTTYSPELAQIPVVTRPGTFYKVGRRTALPTGGFRQVNAGVSAGKSAYKQDVKEMFFADFPINLDEAAYQADDQSTGSILVHEMQGVLQAFFVYIGTQFYYGTAQDAQGFSGIRAQLAGTVAVGTAGSQPNSTSAYLCWLNPAWGIRFDVGNLGAISVNPPIRQQIAAPVGSGNIFAWVTNLSCYIGLSVLSQYSTWAVTGITGTVSNSTYSAPMSDFQAARLVSNIPVTRRQGLVWLMNKTAHATLQASRTSINQQVAGSTGAPAWSPPPNLCEGYPIVVSESILNTENN